MTDQPPICLARKRDVHEVEVKEHEPHIFKRWVPGEWFVCNLPVDHDDQDHHGVGLETGVIRTFNDAGRWTT